MSVTPEPAARKPVTALAVSRYDQVSSLLVAILAVLGLITALMFLAWLSKRLIFVRQPVPVAILEDVGGGGGGGGEAGERELEEPPPEELKEVTDPPIEESLQSITSVVTTEMETLEALDGATGAGSGEGTGSGDGRGPGPGGPGTSDGIPAWERWEVRLAVTDPRVYAEQLDFFQVELGVAGGGRTQVDYVSNVSRATPTVRAGDPKQEKRLRFLHRTSQLRELDRQLAAKAGVNIDGRVVFQFFADETYKRLLTIEAAQMGKRRVKDVLKTVFGVRGGAGRYEFFVIEQHYRPGS